MRHFYKSHGKHCYLRSFQTTCPRCGKDVIYWECTHGSKVFFQYPPYGKLLRHICRKSIGKNIKNKYPVIVKKPKGLLIEPSSKCPICGKLFKNEKNLADHLKSSNRNDELHNMFINKELIKEYFSGKFHTTHNGLKIFFKNSEQGSKFGRINLKKRNK